MLENVERLAAARIQVLPVPGVTSHYLLERDGFAALVERREESLGQVGAAGLVTEKGLAVLVWRGGQGFFVTRNFELPAEPQQIDELRRFSADVKQVLSGLTPR
jgi:hypothetical protein